MELWDILDANGDKTGRLQERGMPMQAGEYHLVVHIWIMNDDNAFLITKRPPGDGDIAGKWQMTGGCAVAGDDSLKTALKETLEETGLALDPGKGRFFKRYADKHAQDDGNYFVDVWFFRHDADISEIKLLPGETCDAMWASKETIISMIESGSFLPASMLPYLEGLFEFV